MNQSTQNETKNTVFRALKKRRIRQSGTRGALTVRRAVGHSGPAGVVVVRVPLRVQVIKENIHLVRGQQLSRGLHVVVSQAVMVRVWVLAVQHGGVVHPPGLIRRRHIHLWGSFSSQKEIQGQGTRSEIGGRCPLGDAVSGHLQQTTTADDSCVPRAHSDSSLLQDTESPLTLETCEKQMQMLIFKKESRCAAVRVCVCVKGENSQSSTHSHISTTITASQHLHKQKLCSDQHVAPLSSQSTFIFLVVARGRPDALTAV